MKINLYIWIEINGKQTLIGQIEGNSYNDASFKYDQDYILLNPNSPLSLSLPIQSNKFSPEQTIIYFDGLLPEGFTRQSICQMAHLNEQDYLALLLYLGKECLGAIRISDTKELKDNKIEYALMTHSEIEELAQEGVSKSAEIVSQSHLSLAGASGKVGLYFNQSNKKWYKPIGIAPSTHIIKTEHVRLKNLVTNELLCTKIAQKLGINVPNTSVIDGKVQLFATERYDRKFTTKSFENFNIPIRLHQEDFAQALGIDSSQKYESDKTFHLEQCFRILRQYSNKPIEDQQKLVEIIVFNLLIGNTDNHIKNVGLLWSEDLRSLSLAPAYDLVSTVIYPQSTRQLAFAIGDQKDIYKITKESLSKASEDAKFPYAKFLDTLNRYTNEFEAALEQVASENIKLDGKDEILSGILKHYKTIKKNLE